MRVRFALVLLALLISAVGVTVRLRSPEPTAASGVLAIASGGEHNCAKVSGSALKCWGRDTQGQLGDHGHCSNACDEAVDVEGLHSGVGAIGAGTHHTCAVDSNDALECWGQNDTGQLGDTTFVNSNVPVKVCGEYNLITQRCVADLTGVTQIVGGDFHTCALIDTGGVKCWGSNLVGQLGAERTCSPGCSLPEYVKGLTANVVAIASGANHACALLNTGSVKCWGENDHGQLGNNTHVSHNTAVDVCASVGQACPPVLTGATAIAAGGERTCVVMNTGHMRCWGENADEDDAAQIVSPRLCSPDCPSPAELCLDYTNAPDPAGCAVPLTGVSAPVLGTDHGCFLRGSTVMCFGDDELGQLGAGDTRCITLLCTEAVEVCTTKACSASLAGASAMSAGWNDTCVIIAGAVKCWGDDSTGQLGDDQDGQSDCDCRKAPVDVIQVKVAPPPTRTPTRTATRPPGTVTHTPTRTATSPGPQPTATRTATPTRPPGGVCGDVNGDGRINSVDAQVLQQYIAGLIQTLREPDNADVNGDGRMNSVDAQLILQHEAGYAVQLHC